jgi:ACT domain-containing protein
MGIINDTINNVIKVQKLANDRIKIDQATEEEDVEDILNPDQL